MHGSYKNFEVAGQIIEAVGKANGHKVQFEPGNSLDIINGKVHIAGVPVADDAAKHLLENMQIKKGFINKVGPNMENWDEVRTSLCGMFSDQGLAMYIDGGIIKKVRSVPFTYNPDVYHETGKSLANSVAQITDRKVNLSSSAFTDGKLILQFTNENTHQLPYGEVWKTGHSVTIDPFGVLLEPYMERVVCSNGMVRQVKTNKYTISHGDSPRKTFQMKLGAPDYTIIGDINEGIVRLKEYNASVREFMSFRRIFESNPSTEISSELSTNPGGESGGFGISEIVRVYGEDIFDKSDRWLSTADSGVNAFDLINSATYITSRPDKYNPSSDVILKTQRLAAKTLLGDLDLQHVAPRFS
jgi:hypothetical protein